MTPRLINVYRTAVYRFYDHTGRLLYVGMAGNFHSRWLEHRRTQPWWRSVDHSRTTTDWHDTREDAKAAETRAIRNERPAYNILGTPRHGACLIRPPNLAAFGLHRVLGSAEIAQGLNVSKPRVQQLVRKPDFPAPLVVLSMGKVWRREDIERWAGARQMRLAGGTEEE